MFTGLLARAAGSAAGKWVSGHLLAVKLILVGLLVAAVVGWHFSRVWAADAAGYARAQAECKAADDARVREEQRVVLEKLAEAQRKQELATQQAAIDTAAVNSTLTAIQNRLAKFHKEFSHAPLAPLPPDCRADRVRVERVNRALGHDG